MNTNNLFEFVYQGFRVTVGATASLVEAIQDPQKREATISELQTELNQRTQEWAEKGENTEREARKFIDGFLKQNTNSSPSEDRSTNQDSTSNSTATNSNDQSELQELTEQIVNLRNELEELRKSKN